MILGGGIDNREADWDAIEKPWFPEIFPNEKDQFVFAHGHFLAAEQRLIGAAGGIGNHGLEQL